MKLIGKVRLGRDAELRRTAAGDAVASFSGAYDYGRKGDDGKRPSQWVEFSMFGKRAESIHEYLTKGSQVVVYGDSPHSEKYQTRDGAQAEKLVCNVDDIELLGSRTDSTHHAPHKPAQKLAPRRVQEDEDIPF